MKRNLLPLLLLLVSTSVYCQMGVGTRNPHGGTIVEISSSNKGILIPRIALQGESDQTSISKGNVESLLVYNTSEKQGLTPGYYYWFNQKWNRILSQGDQQYFTNTTNKSFSIVDHQLVLTDSDNKKVSIALSELGADQINTTLVDHKDGSFTYTNETAQEVVIDVPSSLVNTKSEAFFNFMKDVVKSNQSLTSLVDVVTKHENEFGEEIHTHTLTYTDEKGDVNKIELTPLIKNAETLTSMSYDPSKHQLTYTDERGGTITFDLVDLVGDVQTLTSLELDPQKNVLVYSDENTTKHTIDLSSVVQEPWYSTTTHQGAVSNKDNIYTKGWVGIGQSAPSDIPGEMLRVNGSISVVNSSYADYVFEDYFDGFSPLNLEYSFKDLDSVEEFIKENRHLPGITPIHALDKTDQGYAFNISELSVQLLEKTEELYLHAIELKNDNELKAKRIDELEKSNENFEQRVKKLEDLLLSK